MKYVIAVFMLIILMAGCAPSGNTVPNQPQIPVAVDNRTIPVPPAAAQTADNKTTQVVTSPTLPDTGDAIDKAQESTVLIFSTSQWPFWEAAEGFWYEIEMLKPIISSRSPAPLHWLQHQNKYNWKQGSGVLIDKSGYILTSRSILEDCDDGCGEGLYTTVGFGAQFIYVFLYENGELKIDKDHCYIATLVCKHPQDDLAVIKITPRNESFPYLQMGDSSLVKRGQRVTAVGYPSSMLYTESLSAYKWQTDTIGFSCEPTVSDGTVSAIRSYDTYPGNYTSEEVNKDYKVITIQTNADINSGNSGGPLIDDAGNVIGITVAKVYGASGLGFAIASNETKDLVKTAIARPIEGINDGVFLRCEPGDPCYSDTAWQANPTRRCNALCEKNFRGAYSEKCAANTR